jgi:hypothetical protein
MSHFDLYFSGVTIAESIMVRPGQSDLLKIFLPPAHVSFPYYDPAKKLLSMIKQRNGSPIVSRK